MNSAQLIKTQQLWFNKAFTVDVEEHYLAPLKPDEILVRTECSAISAGTEMLVYRGQIPEDMPLDADLASLQQSTKYPLQYGYASAGRVEQVGEAVDPAWLGRRVFAFQPHASHFITTPQHVSIIPEDISAETAVFLPNMETAVNLVQDGNPSLGERVIVLGQGIVGLLLTRLLSQFPLHQLGVVDAVFTRRQTAFQWAGAHQVFDPFSTADIINLKTWISSGRTPGGADLIYEVSGVPDALNLAIDLSGYTSRLVIGSWYGNKTAEIALGGNAHRNRLKIITSQVSSLAPELTGRWDKARRFDLVWEMLRKTRPQDLITHRVPIIEAQALYRRLHDSPGDILQAIFYYP